MGQTYIHHIIPRTHYICVCVVDIVEPAIYIYSDRALAYSEYSERASLLWCNLKHKHLYNVYPLKLNTPYKFLPANDKTKKKKNNERNVFTR